jgi:integrase
MDGLPKSASGDVDTVREALVFVMARRATAPDSRSETNDRSLYRSRLSSLPFVDWPMCAVQAHHIQEAFDAMASTLARPRGKPSGEKVSRSRIKNAFHLLAVTFDHFLVLKQLGLNPCRSVTIQGRPRGPVQHHWSWRECAALLSFEKIPEAERCLIAFFLGTGARKEEVYLTPRRNLVLDAEEPFWFVEYGAVYGAKATPTKSHTTRRVPLFGIALLAARRWLELTADMNVECSALVGDRWAFPSTHGGRRSEIADTRTWRAWLDAAKVRADVRAHHDMRHTCASLLLSGNMSTLIGAPGPRRRWTIPEIGVLFGHSTVKATECYAHLCDDATRQAAREMTGVAAASEVHVEPIGHPFMLKSSAGEAIMVSRKAATAGFRAASPTVRGDVPPTEVKVFGAGASGTDTVAEAASSTRAESLPLLRLPSPPECGAEGERRRWLDAAGTARASDAVVRALSAAGKSGRPERAASNSKSSQKRVTLSRAAFEIRTRDLRFTKPLLYH